MRTLRPVVGAAEIPLGIGAYAVSALRLRLVVAVTGIPLGVYAYRIQIHDLHSPTNKAVASVAVGWAFLLAGAVAWSRRWPNRLGPLMVVAGYALLARQLRYSHDAVLFTTFFALGNVSYALVGHSALAYPSGRVRDAAERWLVRTGYVCTFVFPPAMLLFYDGTRPLLQFDSSQRKSLLVVDGNAHATELLEKAFVIIFFGVLAALFIALIARRLVQTTPRGRRVLAPLMLAAVFVALRAVWECIFTFVHQPPAIVSDELFWWWIGALIALPLALLAGLLRARLARANVGDLVVELQQTAPSGLRDALARALGDPTLEVALWLSERREFVDADGRSLQLPEDGRERAVTRLEHESEPLAALVHDPSLLDEPKLIKAAGAAARLALENARLHAETRAQLAQVQESRVRIVAAADEERRRIERDIHDGAQQRLVALALQVRSAQRRLGESADPDVERLLAATVNELQETVGELRELARGVHPAVLTEEGLAAALESLVSRTPFPISLDILEERLPEPVEATAYFVVSEALTNVVKHARASTATVSAHRGNGALEIVIEDDGIGGAHVEQGSGLRGLMDRVEALGGQLTVDSPAGGGTRVSGEIPCAS